MGLFKLMTDSRSIVLAILDFLFKYVPTNEDTTWLEIGSDRCHDLMDKLLVGCQGMFTFFGFQKWELYSTHFSYIYGLLH